MTNQANPETRGLTAQEALQAAETIFSQMGGTRRLAMMTGAKNFAFTRRDGFAVASFRIGRNSKGVNHVEVELNGLDLYNVTFRRIHGTKVTVKASHSDIYAEMLVDTFEAETGMYLTF